MSVEELTDEQVAKIDELELEVIAFCENLLSIKIDMSQNHDDNRIVREIMELVSKLGSHHGIPEMDTYPYIEM